MRIFGSDRISGLMQKLGMEENVPIEHGMVSRAIERAQKQVEAQNFGPQASPRVRRRHEQAARKHLRAAPANPRGKNLLEDEEGEQEELDTHDYLMTLAEEILDGDRAAHAARDADAEQWDLEALKLEVARVFAVDVGQSRFLRPQGRTKFARRMWERIRASYEEKETLVGREVLQRVERDIMLQIVDSQWKDHLYSLDHLKEGIGLRGYGQKRSAHRIQAGELRFVPGHEGLGGRGNRPLPVVAASAL